MTTTITPDQVERIVWNQHQDPFEVLGPHSIEQDGKPAWVVRAYQPNAEAVWIVFPEDRVEHPMQPAHHPHFFECVIDTPELKNYQFRLKEGDHERVIYDPYRFRSPYLTDFDIHLFVEGNHHRIYEKLGAHATEVNGVKGVYFAVWAPNARNVSVLSDFNQWDGRKHQMRRIGNGIWELFIPEVKVGDRYKYEIKNNEGHIYEKSDPYGFQQEPRPKTASIVTDLDTYAWQDDAWIEKRRHTEPLTQPISVYEVHLGSWLHASSAEPAKLPDGTEEPVVIVSELKPGARFLTYRELAAKLIPYVKELGFTHIELLPIAEHPFDGSWGYQVIGHYATTSRYGTPQDFMYFVDQCHQQGIGVIVDWVPGHFPKDGHGLAFFDGTHLYEHADPRKGEHKEWGTLVFNYSRNEVRNYLVANALFWFDKYHIDGIRVDAVASMLYLDYCREPGEWVTNQYGGRENIEAADFIRQMNHTIFSYFPGILSIAEESTSWPMVSWPTYVGGLGFNLKWNMGWMHDTLDYVGHDPVHRGYHHNSMTFSLMYAWSESFVLPISHDEVVHGKGSLWTRMPGDDWNKAAGLRSLLAFMWAHPGKQLLFMGGEFGQPREWSEGRSLDWHLLESPLHDGVRKLVGDLNRTYRRHPALFVGDSTPEGFQWIDANDSGNNVASFLRIDPNSPGTMLACVANFAGHPHLNYRVGLPFAGRWREVLNTDAQNYGGSGWGNMGGVDATDEPWHGQPASALLHLPPQGVLWLAPETGPQEV